MIVTGKFGRITDPQRRIMMLLEDGPEEDAVGLEAETLNAAQISVCERLAGRELVRFDIGWRHSCWFRLTPAGREALGLLQSTDRAGTRRRQGAIAKGASGKRSADERNSRSRTGHGKT